MTLVEVSQLLTLISVHFEGTGKFKAEQVRNVQAWYVVLEDLPVDAVAAAWRQWSMSEDWPPLPANLRTIVVEALAPLPTEGEVWNWRWRYFALGTEPESPGGTSDQVAYDVYAAIGSPRDCGRMDEGDLRSALTWAYKGHVERTRRERIAVGPAALTMTRIPSIGDAPGGMRRIADLGIRLDRGNRDV